MSLAAESFEEITGGFSFSEPENYFVEGDPYALAIADFDGLDGPDVVASTESGTVVFFMNSGDGTLRFSQQLLVPSWALNVVAADLDGRDGPDVATADFRTNSVSILRNNGTGVFGVVETYPVGPASSLVDDIVAADFDGVNGLDLAVNHSSFDLPGSNGVSILFNQGDGTFGNEVFYPVNLLGAHGIVAGDLDGASGPDLVVTNRDAGSVWVYLNQGDGALVLSQTFSSPLAPIDQVLEDMDGMNGLDLVVTKFFDSVEIRFNQGDGSFGPGTSYAVNRGWAPAVADFDLDGDTDLVIPSFNSTQLSQMENVGGGQLGPAIGLEIGYLTNQAIAADMDGRGGADLVVSDEDPSASQISVLLNQAGGIPVAIDIKPGERRNVINPGKRGRFWVAVLSGATFDAVQADPGTIALGPGAASPDRYRVKDANRDRLPDLLLRFRTPEVGMACGDTELELTGRTYAGAAFTGVDGITTRGCRKKKADRR